MKDDALPAIVARLREIGFDRLLFGTDWDVMGSPEENIGFLKSRLPLSEAEWKQLLSNQASYLVF